MPHQSQGACMAIEDAAALGILFNKKYFGGDVRETLAIYEKIRLPRATKVQASAAKAAYNINERIGKFPNAQIPLKLYMVSNHYSIGFSSNTTMSNYKVEDEARKLTIEEMNGYDMYKDVEQALAEKKGEQYNDKYIRGLPFGLELPNGIVIDSSWAF